MTLVKDPSIWNALSHVTSPGFFIMIPKLNLKVALGLHQSHQKQRKFEAKSVGKLMLTALFDYRGMVNEPFPIYITSALS